MATGLEGGQTEEFGNEDRNFLLNALAMAGSRLDRRDMNHHQSQEWIHEYLGVVERMLRSGYEVPEEHMTRYRALKHQPSSETV